MAWLGIWFEHGAGAGERRSPEHFQGLVPPIVYPFAHTFIEEESRRLGAARDPGTALRGGERFRVFYSLSHDGGQSALDQQGCRIIRWLLESLIPAGPCLSSRFSEVPVVIHEEDPAKAAALGNALALLRFLGAREDQAIARILIHPWAPLRWAHPRLAAQEHEKRVIEFLHGETFYPEDVDLFDVLERNDLKAHRDLNACCLTQIGFIAPLLEWADECWPRTAAERRDLEAKLRNSLLDEVRTLRKKGAPAKGPKRRYEFEP